MSTSTVISASSSYVAAPSIVLPMGSSVFKDSCFYISQTKSGAYDVSGSYEICDYEKLTNLCDTIRNIGSLNRLARMLEEAALAIASYWEEHFYGHQIVVLGRDGWPLVPLLQELDLPATYFIFSRLQIGDEGTKNQWLKEVSPEALVVDTGYAGSIFDAIMAFDPSINGLLLCSEGDYPEVSFSYNHAEVVKEIEKLPKIVGRGVAINSKGIVRCPQDTRDSDENIEGLSPADVVELNKKLCKLLNVHESWASFTGLTPETRIPWDLEEWYGEVKLYRQTYTENSALEVSELGTFVCERFLEQGFDTPIPLPLVWSVDHWEVSWPYKAAKEHIASYLHMETCGWAKAVPLDRDKGLIPCELLEVPF